ncbi:Haloacid dehalogenase-like hydrolase-domain-containing protein [Podospora fimiseda]|uniref:Haloacid dehalogenase-like hydrolase-domain-containing protein n=1 Tax=Podospora fimiseda TaxID=252190 RepID=A0AAN7BJD7_9PEZI|nr:Haloacid dehalogenase-like hydrolase-domain-containing protein [Podospora fimiseda]
MAPTEYDAIIFDLGVFFDWDSSATTTLPPKIMQEMMASNQWHNLEKNIISADEAYTSLAKYFSVEPLAVSQALDQAQSTLRVNQEGLRLIQDLIEAKRISLGRLKVYAMSNIAQKHFNIVQNNSLFQWSVFDRIFTSSEAGMRKPDLCFYRHVIKETACKPSRTLYFDDKTENICAGRLLGLRGEIVHRDQRRRAFNIVRHLLLDDTSSRAERFLRANAGKLDSVILMPGEDIVLKDNFAQLLIWGLTGMEDIVYLIWPDGTVQGDLQQPVLAKSKESTYSILSTDSPSAPDQHQDSVKNGLWCYFAQKPILTHNDYPADIDTTSVAYLNIPTTYHSYHRLANPALVAEAILANRNADDHWETYLDSDRHGRINPEACVSALRFINKYAAAGLIPGILSLDVEDKRVAKTRDLIVAGLANRAILYGDRFYPLPEPFLYWVSMLFCECKDSSPKLHADLGKHLEQALMERLHIPLNALALAMRVRACQLIGMKKELVQPDLDNLLAMQEEDGGWPAGFFCSYGRIQSQQIGSRGYATALVWRILKD